MHAEAEFFLKEECNHAFLFSMHKSIRAYTKCFITKETNVIFEQSIIRDLSVRSLWFYFTISRKIMHTEAKFFLKNNLFTHFYSPCVKVYAHIQNVS